MKLILSAVTVLSLVSISLRCRQGRDLQRPGAELRDEVGRTARGLLRGVPAGGLREDRQIRRPERQRLAGQPHGQKKPRARLTRVDRCAAAQRRRAHFRSAMVLMTRLES